MNYIYYIKHRVKGVVIMDETVKPKFALSKSNKIFYLISAILFTLAMVGTFFIRELPPLVISQKIGEICGSWAGFLLIPSLFSWIAWRLSQRNTYASSWTFNILLTLLLANNISNIAIEEFRFAMLNKMQAGIEIDETKQPGVEQMDDVVDQYNKTLDQAAFAATSEEKRLIEVMKNYTVKTQEIATQWSLSIQDLHYSDFIDLRVMKNEMDVFNKLKQVDDCIEKTNTYIEHTNNSVQKIRDELVAKELSKKIIEDTLKGIEENFNNAKPLTINMLKENLAYAKNLKEMLNFMLSNKNKWSIDSGELTFDEETVSNEFDELENKIISNLDNIENFVSQLQQL